MKKITGISACVFLFSVAVFLCWLQPVPGELFNAWSDMLAGRPFNWYLFLIPWVLLFELTVTAWLTSLTRSEQQTLRELIPSAGLNPLLLLSTSASAQIQTNGLTEMQPLTPEEITDLRHVQNLEKGPGVLNADGWKTDVDTAIAEFPHQAVDPLSENILPPGSSSWLVMDIEEATTYPETGISLSRSIEDLLSEQKNAVYGLTDFSESATRKDLAVQGMGFLETDDPLSARNHENLCSLKVVFRAQDLTESSIPEHLRLSLESKKDAEFYRMVKSALSE